jgi:hypothetical protein
LGAACEGGIAIYDQVVIDLFERFDTEAKQRFLRIVIEEIFHYFAKQTNEFRNSEITQEQSKKLKGLTPQERWLIGSEIEVKYGVKQMVNELLQILEQKEKELFSALPLKIEDSSNNYGESLNYLLTRKRRFGNFLGFWIFLAAFSTLYHSDVWSTAQTCEPLFNYINFFHYVSLFNASNYIYSLINSTKSSVTAI